MGTATTSKLDLTNCRTANAILNGKVFPRNLAAQCPNFFSLNIRQFGIALVFSTTGIGKSRLPRMGRVFLGSNPLKVIGSIVGTVSVNVIDLTLGWIFRLWDKRFGHKFVNPNTAHNPIARGAGPQVPSGPRRLDNPSGLSVATTAGSLEPSVVADGVIASKSRSRFPLFIHNLQNNRFILSGQQ